MYINTDEEIWKDIPGFEGFYQASNLGRIRSLDREVVVSRGNSQFTQKIKGTTMKHFDSDGYPMIALRKNGIKTQKYVHGFVARAFLGEKPKGKFVNHKNEIRTDNRVSNLEYITHKENINYGTRTEKVVKKLSHPVVAINIDNGERTEYESIQAAMRDGFNHVHDVLVGKRNHSKRHTFERL